MSNTDVTTNQLVINEITKTQLAETDLPDNELILEDPEFVGGKFLKTTSDGNIEEADVDIVQLLSTMTLTAAQKTAILEALGIHKVSSMPASPVDGDVYIVTGA